MKKKLNRVLNLAGKIAKMEALKVDSARPPICAGFLHQPKRPTKVK